MNRVTYSLGFSVEGRLRVTARSDMQTKRFQCSQTPFWRDIVSGSCSRQRRPAAILFCDDRLCVALNRMSVTLSTTLNISNPSGFVLGPSDECGRLFHSA